MLNTVGCIIALAACVAASVYAVKFYRLIGYKPLITLPIAFIYASILRVMRLLYALDVTQFGESGVSLVGTLFFLFYVLVVVGIYCVYRAAKKGLGG